MPNQDLAHYSLSVTPNAKQTVVIHGLHKKMSLESHYIQDMTQRMQL